MLPADQTVDVVPIDEQEHEYAVKLRNAKPIVEPPAELKLETLAKAELPLHTAHADDKAEL